MLSSNSWDWCNCIIYPSQGKRKEEGEKSLFTSCHVTTKSPCTRVNCSQLSFSLFAPSPLPWFAAQVSLSFSLVHLQLSSFFVQCTRMFLVEASLRQMLLLFCSFSHSLTLSSLFFLFFFFFSLVKCQSFFSRLVNRLVYRDYGKVRKNLFSLFEENFHSIDKCFLTRDENSYLSQIHSQRTDAFEWMVCIWNCCVHSHASEEMWNPLAKYFSTIQQSIDKFAVVSQRQSSSHQTSHRLEREGEKWKAFVLTRCSSQEHATFIHWSKLSYRFYYVFYRHSYSTIDSHLQVKVTR